MRRSEQRRRVAIARFEICSCRRLPFSLLRVEWKLEAIQVVVIHLPRTCK